MTLQRSPKAVDCAAASRLSPSVDEPKTLDHELQLARVRQSLLYVRRGPRPRGWSALDVLSR
jgi:hypothetical protein